MENKKEAAPQKLQKTDKILIVAVVVLISVIGIVMLLAEQAEITSVTDEREISLPYSADYPVVAAVENEDGKMITPAKEADKINLNTASKETLMELDGIGEVRAESIIAYREKTPFRKPSDIMNVDGIGQKTYEKNKDRICIN